MPTPSKIPQHVRDIIGEGLVTRGVTVHGTMYVGRKACVWIRPDGNTYVKYRGEDDFRILRK